MDLLELGDVATAEREIDLFDRMAAELRQPLNAGYSALFRATLAILRGKYDEGEALAAQALEIGQRANSTTAIAFYGAQMSRLWVDKGLLAGMEPALREIIDQQPQYSSVRPALAFFLAELGRIDEARTEFELLARGGFADAALDTNWATTIVYLSLTCYILRDRDRATLLYEMVRPYADRNLVSGPPPVQCFGPASYYLGLLATAMGLADTALEHFEHAMSMSRNMGAKPALARSQAALGRWLLTRDGRAERERAIELLRESFETARALGMEPLRERTEALLSEAGTPPAAAVSAEPEIVAAGTSPASGRFIREGEYWSITYGGAVSRFREAKGFRYLGHLLANPGKDFHVFDLASAVEGSPVTSVPADTADASMTAVSDLGDAGEVLDDKAKAAYRARLTELSEDLEEAERWADPERASRIREEIDALTDQLAAAVGLGGRDRKAASHAERERLRVTKSIRSAVRRIAESDAGLGRHLESAVRTGYFCSYSPDPEHPVAWIT
jgi:tetratricopeptide (TPR) repeat protein